MAKIKDRNPPILTIENAGYGTIELTRDGNDFALSNVFKGKEINRIIITIDALAELQKVWILKPATP